MAVETRSRVICDRCQRPSLDVTGNVGLARYVAKRQHGWERPVLGDQRMDLCPDCWAALRDAVRQAEEHARAAIWAAVKGL